MKLLLGTLQKLTCKHLPCHLPRDNNYGLIITEAAMLPPTIITIKIVRLLSDAINPSKHCHHCYANFFLSLPWSVRSNLTLSKQDELRGLIDFREYNQGFVFKLSSQDESGRISHRKMFLSRILSLDSHVASVNYHQLLTHQVCPFQPQKN